MDPTLGEIRLFPFIWAPKGWVVCAGQLLTISGNQALFSLLGTNYGGDGKTTFGVPDLRGRVPIGIGRLNADYPLALTGGQENHTLLTTEMPKHTHSSNVVTAPADSSSAKDHLFAQIAPGGPGYPSIAVYAPYDGQGDLIPLAPSTVGLTGGSGPHTNMQPWAVANYCIATAGTYPSRN